MCCWPHSVDIKVFDAYQMLTLGSDSPISDFDSLGNLVRSRSLNRLLMNNEYAISAPSVILKDTISKDSVFYVRVINPRGKIVYILIDQDGMYFDGKDLDILSKTPKQTQGNVDLRTKLLEYAPGLSGIVIETYTEICVVTARDEVFFGRSTPVNSILIFPLIKLSQIVRDNPLKLATTIENATSKLRNAVLSQLTASSQGIFTQLSLINESLTNLHNYYPEIIVRLKHRDTERQSWLETYTSIESDSDRLAYQAIQSDLTSTSGYVNDLLISMTEFADMASQLEAINTRVNQRISQLNDIYNKLQG